MDITAVGGGGPTNDETRAGCISRFDASSTQAGDVLLRFGISRNCDEHILNEQIRSYGRNFGRWTEPTTEAGLVARQALIEATISRSERTISTVELSDTIVQLQGNLIIFNINEFLLFSNPSRSEFERIVTDCVDWHKRVGSYKLPHLTRSLEESADRLANRAIVRFETITSKL